MKLNEVLNNVQCEIYGDGDTLIKGIEYDSRAVKDGYIFFALPGAHVDGRSFAIKAIEAGAAVIVADVKLDLPEGRVMVVVKDILSAMAGISANYYGHPDKKLMMVGITGTNGKTTITYLIESIFTLAKLPTGVVGTVNYRYAGRMFAAPNTTPQSAELYKILNDMVHTKQAAAVMEVSSHALSLSRVEGMEFDIAVFTNLTRDHLDFHLDMEKYFSAKSQLFTGLRPGQKGFAKHAVINVDDEWGRKLVRAGIKGTVITYGINNAADIMAENIKTDHRNTEFTIICPLGRRRVCLQYLGLYNVYNALAAAGAAIAAGIAFETVIQGLVGAPLVPGRLEKVDDGQPFAVVVDYAHTDDALSNVLKALSGIKTGRLITVFGCGGDRDRSKRPIMGEIATALSDYVFVTSDNPRTEDPEKIALDIEVGIRRQHRTNYQVLLNREEAIAAAIAMAHKGDVVLLAGKGHETYQIIGNEKIHFNDAEIAVKYIRQYNSTAKK
jgi:UDP-N-acetylmuramoyl-L-alanyl-D-glutamate--2,6-diaminopimelate ligase